MCILHKEQHSAYCILHKEHIIKFKKKEERKITYRSGGNGTEIDFVLVGRNQRKYVTDVKVIPGELQHGLIVANVRGRKLKRPGRKTNIICRRVWKLKEEETKSNFKHVMSCVERKLYVDMEDAHGGGMIMSRMLLRGRRKRTRHGAMQDLKRTRRCTIA